MSIRASDNVILCFAPCRAEKVENGLCHCHNRIMSQTQEPLILSGKTRTLAEDILIGTAVGDALGVPVEFEDRHTIARNPVKEMRAYGTHAQPAGTFSDDSSLMFCLAESLTAGFDLQDIANRSAEWYLKGYWTPHGHVFDIGIATRAALHRVSLGFQPDLCGGMNEDSNGNGSLMRILPLVAFIKDKEIGERYELTKLVSSITHGHVRSVISCFYYLEFARHIIDGKSKEEAYILLQTEIPAFLQSINMSAVEISKFDRLFTTDISQYPVEKIYSSGYVFHTLVASIWCLLTTNNYHDAVLKAVNLGSDTDTTGAVTGGLAAIYYGADSIPQEWVNQLARKDDILDLANRLNQTYPF